jgi:hypothetical protein
MRPPLHNAASMQMATELSRDYVITSYHYNTRPLSQTLPGNFSRGHPAYLRTPIFLRGRRLLKDEKVRAVPPDV